MPYFHVRIEVVEGHRHDGVFLDLDERRLIDAVVLRYRQGQPIICGGRSVALARILRLRIGRTDLPSATLLPLVRRREAAGAAWFFPPPAWHLPDLGDDVTDAYVEEHSG